MEQTLELVIDNFHSLLSYDFNIDGVTEIIAAKLQKNNTEVIVAYPKQLSSHSVKINERINTMCMARTSVDGGVELVSGDYKGVIRINSKKEKPFFTKDIKDGIRLPSSVISMAPGDLNGNRLSEVVVGCRNGEIVMIERIPGKKQRWDKIRGFSLGRVFPSEVFHLIAGDFNGNGRFGFVSGAKNGQFKEIEFRPQLQKFDLLGEFSIEAEPSYCFCGDIDKDGIAEVFVGDVNGILRVYKKNKLMSTHNLGGIITCGTVGDVDNDSKLEAVVGTASGAFHILRQNTIESYEGYSNIADMKIGDLSGNRQNDLIFSIDKRRIIAFTFMRDKLKEKPNVELIPFGPTGAVTQKAVSAAAATSTKKQSDIDTEAVFCPNCQGGVDFIAEYRRFYCYKCRKYVAPVTKEELTQPKEHLIEPQSHGTPYEAVSSAYSPYQAYDPVSSPYAPKQAYEPRTEQASQTGGSSIDMVKAKVESSLSDFSPGQKLEWHEESDATPESEVDYFVPLDIEAMQDKGAEFFNDLLNIKHVIIIHAGSGVPIFSQGFGKEIDVSLTSGFLSAVGTFTEEMAGEQNGKRVGVFSEIGREGFWILIYEGEISKAAFLINDKMGPIVKRRIKMFMKEFEKTYAKELANFDGFVSAFRETTDLLEKHLKVEYLYPLKIDLKRMRLTTISKYEKIIAKNYIQHLKQATNDVFYVTELIQIILENPKTNVPREELLKILIKYLENNILIPLPPPPSDPM